MTNPVQIESAGPSRAPTRHALHGFTLIELLVALAIGALLIAGLVAAVVAIRANGRAQQDVAAIVDGGRYAAALMSEEIRSVGAQYCSSYANSLPGADGTSPLRPPMVGTGSGLPGWVPASPSGTRYAIDPGLFLRGYECAASTCAPVLPTAAQDVNLVPAAGTVAGRRLPGTDVLTVRYLLDRGAPLGTAVAAGTDPVLLGTPLTRVATDRMLVADCSGAEIFASGGTDPLRLDHTVAQGNYLAALAGNYRRSRDARVFNFTRDFISVTYYVGVRLNAAGTRIGVLLRAVNGAAPEEVLTGVDRFDLRYRVVAGRRTYLLSAADIAANPTGMPGVPCPPLATAAASSGSCLWRAVHGVEVSMLLNSGEEFGTESRPYRYLPDGDAPHFRAPTDAMPSGLPAGRYVRKPLTFYTSLHNVVR